VLQTLGYLVALFVVLVVINVVVAIAPTWVDIILYGVAIVVVVVSAWGETA
jgi:hypothetical protein